MLQAAREYSPEAVTAPHAELPLLSGASRRLGNISTNELVALTVIKDIPVGFFNALAVEDPVDPESTLLMGRYAPQAGAPGEGDPGDIVLVTVKDNAVVPHVSSEGKESAFLTLFKHQPGGVQYEDVRGHKLNRNGKLVLGMTRLALDSSDPFNRRHKPFPAWAETSVAALKRGEWPETHFIRGIGTGYELTPIDEGQEVMELLVGKNVTPTGNGQFMFRPEAENHRLLVVSLKDKHQASVSQYLDFPTEMIPDWGKDRMGTTISPVWRKKPRLTTDKREGLMILHGFKRIDGKPEYVISLGLVSLDSNGIFKMEEICDEPLLTPDNLGALYPGKDVQLHPDERRASYMVGATVTYNKSKQPEKVIGYPCVGDTRTSKAVFDVEACFDKLKS